MDAPRNRPRPLYAAALAFAALFTAACGSSPSFASPPDLEQAEVAWCDMLGKGVAGGTWDQASECKAAHPAGSAAFLKAMTRCYSNRRESSGDDAPDPGALVAECRDEVLLELPASDANSSGLVAVRCARQQRCEKVAPDDCKASFAKLDAAQRAMMSTMYDGRALTKIADCLDSAPCKDDGDEDRCYANVADDLVYFPH